MKKSISKISVSYFLLLLSFIGVFSCDVKTNSNTVTIKGKIINHELDEISLNNYSSKTTVFENKNYRIPLNSNKEFEYTFSLAKPAYFTIGRQYLYLSPGDNIDMHLDTGDRSVATFKGKGAEANTYLSKLTYPKAGSFWTGGILSSSISSYKEVPLALNKIMDEKHAELDATENLSEDFVKLEKARLNFEYVNSLQSVYYLFRYQSIKSKKKLSSDERNSKYDEAMEYYAPFITKHLKNFNNTDYLQFEVYQNVLYSIQDEKFREKYQLPNLNNKLKDYVLAKNLISKFSEKGYTKEFQEAYNSSIANIKSKDYLAVLTTRLKEYETIKSGKDASDVTFSNLKGDAIKLSKYKGSVIVVDLWATWCGPCMKEKPFFESLEKKYIDKNVTFLYVSIDKKKVWEDYFDKNPETGKQLHIYRKDLSEYKIESIPRFFVIDKNFKIIDVFAPLPSSGELETLIDQSLI